MAFLDCDRLRVEVRGIVSLHRLQEETAAHFNLLFLLAQGYLVLCHFRKTSVSSLLQIVLRCHAPLLNGDRALVLL